MRNINRLLILALIALTPLLGAGPAAAHPHVFVRVTSTLVYGEDGVPREIRHSWTFDEMFSAFAVQGLDTDGDGKYSREELTELAEINVSSLSEFDFFTFAKAAGEDVSFGPPQDYWLTHDGEALTLHFTLPVSGASPTADGRPLVVEIYDPTYFVAFELQKETPALLAHAPATCRVDGEAPDVERVFGQSGQLSESFFDNLDPAGDFGRNFANVLTVRCGAQAEAYATRLAAKEKTEAAAQDQAFQRVQQALGIVEAQPLAQAPVTGAGSETASSADPEKPETRTRSGALGAFGVVRPDAGSGATSGFFGWISTQQSAFYRQMSAAMMQSRTDHSGGLMLAMLAFAYGVFHAAGPGHGKAVIASYLVASGETLRRGVMLSFAAAGAQAVTAIAIVFVLASLLGWTSQAMGVASWWLEAASYGLIVALGLMLVWRKSGSFFAALKGRQPAHDCGPDCGHSHAPDPALITGDDFNWRRALSAVLAVGLRPCTGALVVLVFALAQGMFWAGVGATFAMALGTAITVTAIAALAVWAKGLALSLASGTPGAGNIMLRGLEMLAGLVVLLFGLALLGGILVTGTPSAG